MSVTIQGQDGQDEWVNVCRRDQTPPDGQSWDTVFVSPSLGGNPDVGIRTPMSTDLALSPAISSIDQIDGSKGSYVLADAWRDRNETGRESLSLSPNSGTANDFDFSNGLIGSNTHASFMFQSHSQSPDHSQPLSQAGSSFGFGDNSQSAQVASFPVVAMNSALDWSGMSNTRITPPMALSSQQSEASEDPNSTQVSMRMYPQLFADQDPRNEPWSSERRMPYPMTQPDIPFWDMELDFFPPQSTTLNPYNPYLSEFPRNPSIVTMSPTEEPYLSTHAGNAVLFPPQNSSIGNSPLAYSPLTHNSPIPPTIPHTQQPFLSSMVPGVPGVPQIAQVPQGPQVSQIPQVPHVPQVPQVPQVAQVPQVPQVSSRSNSKDSTQRKASPGVQVVLAGQNQHSKIRNTLASRQNSSTSPSQQPVVIVHEDFSGKKGKNSQGLTDYQAHQRIGKHRSGGRALGSHLDADTAAHAKQMRNVVACWICALQRDKCKDVGSGTCGPCTKRQLNRLHNEHSLGCDRTKLVDFKDDLLPKLMTAHFETIALEEFAQDHIREMMPKRIDIHLTCGKGLPTLSCTTYEAIPRTDELLRQWRAVLKKDVAGWEFTEVRAAPLVMGNTHSAAEYEKYLDEIVDKHLLQFADLCFRNASSSFQIELLKLICSLKPTALNPQKGKHSEEPLRLLFKFIISRFFISRTWFIPEDEKFDTLRQLSSYREGEDYGKCCSPRMTNKQIKSVFNTLHSRYLHAVLKCLQTELRWSHGCWTTCFILILGLAMVTEDCQMVMHATTDSFVKMGKYSQWEGNKKSEYHARNQDERLQFFTALFRLKYTKNNFNPIRDPDLLLAKAKEQDKLNPEAKQFARDIGKLISDHFDFLDHRRYVSVAYENRGVYTSKHVARFLLHFWTDVSA